MRAVLPLAVAVGLWCWPLVLVTVARAVLRRSLLDRPLTRPAQADACLLLLELALLVVRSTSRAARDRTRLAVRSTS